MQARTHGSNGFCLLIFRESDPDKENPDFRNFGILLASTTGRGPFQ
jgi:hypothetical protein